MEKWVMPRLWEGRYKISLEYLVLLEIRKVLKKNNFEITGLKGVSPSLEKIWHKLSIKISKEGNEYSPIE